MLNGAFPCCTTGTLVVFFVTTAVVSDEDVGEDSLV